MANQNTEMNSDPFMDYLKTKGLSKNTLYLYGRYYQRFKLMNFNQENINKFFANKKHNNSISRAFLKSLLEFLHLEEEFEMPPKITSKRKKKIVRNLSSKQIKSIRQEAYNKSKTLGFLFDFIYYGALRRSEVGNIKINSFNWDLFFEEYCQKPCELKLENTKGNKERMVLIPAHVMKEFADYYMKSLNIVPQSTNDYLAVFNIPKPIFIKKNKTLLDGWKIWKIIKQLSNKAIGIEIRPHELRHARATELENKGHNIRTIQHYLGHSSPQITEVYLHTSEKHSLEKIKEMMQNE